MIVLCMLQMIAAEQDSDRRSELEANIKSLQSKLGWLRETLIHVIVSEAQGEVAEFRKWGFDIVPHRALMKRGFESSGSTVDVERAFKSPRHPFRIAIVCAMWLTGFDVEALSTLYVDKPMKAHTLMQAIARANRRFPGKDFGLIVDYNDILASLRAALAQYALGEDGQPGVETVAPIEDRVAALIDAITEAESLLLSVGFDSARLLNQRGFAKAAAFADAVEALYSDDDVKRRFEIVTRIVFIRFKALISEPIVLQYSGRHDNLETIYKKLNERRDVADVSGVLDALRRIVNEAVVTQHTKPVVVGADKLYDLSSIDLEKLRDEFSKSVRRKATAIEDIRAVVEKKLAEMLTRNPQRIDYYKKYQDIIADYNPEKDRVTIEDTFDKLVDFAASLDPEQKRAMSEGLTEDQLALFDLLQRDKITVAQREQLKAASRDLLDALQRLLPSMNAWTEKHRPKPK